MEANNNANKKISLQISRSTLKIIAIILMLIDHVSYIFIYPIAKRFGVPLYSLKLCLESKNLYAISYYFGRFLGRGAFVIYCFLLVEGFNYTRSKMKYAMRLLLFAFISEIPFDLAFAKSVFDLKHQNIFFTLFFGIMVLICHDKVKRYFESKESQMLLPSIDLMLITYITTVFALIAYLLKTDYGAYGVVAIATMYFIMNYTGNKLMSVTSGIITCVMMSTIELGAIIILPFVAIYNGKKGIRAKLIFYLFYPIHFLVLYFIWYFLQK